MPEPVHALILPARLPDPDRETTVVAVADILPGGPGVVPLQRRLEPSPARPDHLQPKGHGLPDVGAFVDGKAESPAVRLDPERGEPPQVDADDAGVAVDEPQCLPAVIRLFPSAPRPAERGGGGEQLPPRPPAHRAG